MRDVDEFFEFSLLRFWSLNGGSEYDSYDFKRLCRCIKPQVPLPMSSCHVPRLVFSYLCRWMVDRQPSIELEFIASRIPC